MKVEIRNNQAVIEGYVNVADRISKPIPNVRGSFREKVAQGAFSKALKKNHNVELRYNHKRKLGDQQDGSLELREDNIGLYAKAIVSDAEVIEKARNQELRGWSFGFSAIKDDWTKEGDTEVRKLQDINLMEVSILSVSPAYSATSISVRADAEDLVEYRAYEEKKEDVTVTESDEDTDTTNPTDDTGDTTGQNQEGNSSDDEPNGDNPNKDPNDTDGEDDDEQRKQEEFAKYQEIIQQFKKDAPVAKG